MRTQRADLAHCGRAHSGPTCGPTRSYTVRGGRSRPSSDTLEWEGSVAGNRSAPMGSNACTAKPGDGSGGAEQTAEQRLQAAESSPEWLSANTS